MDKRTWSRTVIVGGIAVAVLGAMGIASVVEGRDSSTVGNIVIAIVGVVGAVAGRPSGAATP